jgi:hypothetical protein
MPDLGTSSSKSVLRGNKVASVHVERENERCETVTLGTGKIGECWEGIKLANTGELVMMVPPSRHDHRGINRVPPVALLHEFE